MVDDPNVAEPGAATASRAMTAPAGFPTPAAPSSGALKVPDPERAAWQFVDLCQSYVYKRLLFGVVDSIGREDIEASVEAGVDVFMKAYGAPQRPV